MRTLGEIIDAAKGASPVTHDELLYALLAYSSLHYFDHHALQVLAQEPSRFHTPQGEYEEAFSAFQDGARKVAPGLGGLEQRPSQPRISQVLQDGKALGRSAGSRGSEATGREVMTHVWYWRTRLGERKGQRCRVLARSRPVLGENRNSILVEFDDGYRVVTSRHAVRRGPARERTLR